MASPAKREAADAFRIAIEPVQDLIEWTESRPPSRNLYCHTADRNAEADALAKAAYAALLKALALYTCPVSYVSHEASHEQ